MAKKHANKKPKVKIDKFNEPVIKLFQGLFENLMINITSMENAIKSLDGALSSYIDFNGNGNEWKEWVEIKLKEVAKKREEKSGDKHKNVSNSNK